MPRVPDDLVQKCDLGAFSLHAFRLRADYFLLEPVSEGSIPARTGCLIE